MIVRVRFKGQDCYHYEWEEEIEIDNPDDLSTAEMEQMATDSFYNNNPSENYMSGFQATEALVEFEDEEGNEQEQEFDIDSGYSY